MLETTAQQIAYLRQEILVQIFLQILGWLVFLSVISACYIRLLLLDDPGKKLVLSVIVTYLVILLFAFSARQDYAIHKPAGYIASVAQAAPGRDVNEVFSSWDEWRRNSNYTI